MDKEYYVIMSHNFDAETYNYKVDDYDTAVALLHYLWEEYYNEEIKAGSHLNEDACYHEDDIAVVEWEDGDYTEFILIEGTDKVPDEFWKVKESYMRTRR